MSDKSSELRQWVEHQWPELAINDFSMRADFDVQRDRAPSWQALHGDAGFRRYFRLASEPPLLAVYAPPESENSRLFIDIARHLRRHGVLTPAIAAADIDKGFLLIEDLGAGLLLDELDDSNVEDLYKSALSALLLMQGVSPAPLNLPVYDQALLRKEMQLFDEWFVEKLLQRRLNVVEKHMLSTWYSALEESALDQPRVLVHRDYHSRNLIFRRGGPPGVIDFQDAVVGPFTYDLVSLLRDCYIEWPAEDVRRWALNYRTAAYEAGVIIPCSEAQFMQWFDWMGLQRHIKVLGIFARLSLRDQKHGYLQDLPLVIDYTLSIASQYPEGQLFAEWFATELLPLAQKQPWFNGRQKD